MEAQNEVKATGTFDVAISFLARDEKVASALCDVIGDGLNVFFFPRKQEELAGTNGLESMRTPFLTSRVVVVLYRVPWGETNWTRVEQAAVTDRFLKEGWDWLLFVQLDETRLPVWLPDTNVRFALGQYGLEQLAGAVKMRVQQRGGRIEAPSALGRARQVKQEADLIADQNSFFRDARWIEQNIHPSVESLMARIAELGVEIQQKLGMNFVARHEGQRCVLRNDRISINVGWQQTERPTVGIHPGDPFEQMFHRFLGRAEYLAFCVEGLREDAELMLKLMGRGFSIED